MPLDTSRRLTGRTRSAAADRHLGFTLAFVAGATNAGGFLAVRQYTSHMTGIVSAIADEIALGHGILVLAGLGALTSFVIGAACSAVMINLARRLRLHSEFAFPLLVEAVLLLVFGTLGARLARIEGLFVPATVMLLCFIMGLQNAMISKLSNSAIRTTHVTGIVTDIGIEVGKWLYCNLDDAANRSGGKVVADRERLAVLSRLFGCFVGGGVAGAIGFSAFGYLSTIPLALLLVALAVAPVADDIVNWIRPRARRP